MKVPLHEAVRSFDDERSQAWPSSAHWHDGDYLYRYLLVHRRLTAGTWIRAPYWIATRWGAFARADRSIPFNRIIL